MSVVTYGGIALPEPTDEVEAWVDDNISLNDIAEFAYQNWPGRNRVVWPLAFLERRTNPKLGRLHWPVGASRWASFHSVVTNTILKSIRTAAYAGNSLNPLNLVFDDGNSRVVTAQQMYLLPARPLANQVSNGEALWLITLVDQRYFWWDGALAIAITGTSTSLTGGTTTWANLFTSIAAALPGAPTITTDAISANYLKPSSDLVSNYEFIPPLLDAVCANVGHRLVVSLAGALTTQSAATAAAQTFSPAAGWTICGGGKWNLDTSFASNDLDSCSPASITVVFPKSTGTRNVGPYYTVNKTLAGLSLTRYGSSNGYPGTKVFRDSAVANYNGGSPVNATELGNLAGQIAKDYYLWRIPLVDVAFDGAVPWTPESYYDIIYDWTTATRLTGAEFNSPIEDFNHYATSGAAAIEILPERPAIAKQTGTATAASGYWAFTLETQDAATGSTNAGNQVEVWDPNGVLSSTTAGSYYSIVPQDSLTSTPKRLYGIGINVSTGMTGAGSTITIQGELTTTASPPTITTFQTGVTGLKPNGTSGLYVETAVSNVVQMGVFEASTQQAGTVRIGSQTWLGPKNTSEASVAGGGTFVAITLTNANLASTAFASLQYDVPALVAGGRDSTSAVLPSVIVDFSLHDSAIYAEVSTGVSAWNNAAWGVVDNAGTAWTGHYGTTWEGNTFKGGLWISASGQPVIDVPHGGTNRTSLTAFNLIVGNGTSAVALVPPGTINLPLVSMGASANPGYTVLTVPGGGTGASTWTVGAVLCGNSTSTLMTASPTTVGFILTDNGVGNIPSFQAFPLAVQYQDTSGNVANVTIVQFDKPSGFAISSPSAGIALVKYNANFPNANLLWGSKGPISSTNTTYPSAGSPDTSIALTANALGSVNDCAEWTASGNLIINGTDSNHQWLMVELSGTNIGGGTFRKVLFDSRTAPLSGTGGLSYTVKGNFMKWNRGGAITSGNSHAAAIVYGGNIPGANDHEMFTDLDPLDFTLATTLEVYLATTDNGGGTGTSKNTLHQLILHIYRASP